MGATPFPELNTLLSDFAGRVQSILDTNFVGIYLVGSLALGGADAASDCDFLVVTSGRVSGGQEHALRQLHAEILDWPGYWAYNLEGSYAPKADLQTLAALAQPVAACSTHSNAAKSSRSSRRSIGRRTRWPPSGAT